MVGLCAAVWVQLLLSIVLRQPFGKVATRCQLWRAWRSCLSKSDFPAPAGAKSWVDLGRKVGGTHVQHQSPCASLSCKVRSSLLSLACVALIQSTAMICCGVLRQVCGLWAHGHCAWIWPVRRPAESAPYLHHRQLRLASSAGILLVDNAADVARKDFPHLSKILQQGSESAAPGVDVQLPVRTSVWSVECAAESEGASTKQVRCSSVLPAELLPSAKVLGR